MENYHELKNRPKYLAPFLIFFAIGILVVALGAYVHIVLVKKLVKNRLSHIPKAKKVKVKKNKKKDKKKNAKKSKE